MTRHDSQRTAESWRIEADRALGEVALGNSDFEKLKSLMDAEVDQKGEGRRKIERGLIGLATIVLAAGVVVQSPWRTDEEPAPKAAATALVEPSATLEGETPKPAEPELSPTAVLPASVARAASVVFSNGRQVGRGGHYDVRLTTSARHALQSVGIRVPPRSESSAVREAAFVRGLGLLYAELGSLEAALTCMRADRELVEAALDLAYGSNLPDPDRFESFARYLPPAARRAAEGPTRRVMALAIGYDMQWPVPESTRVSSPFGPRHHPVLGQDAFHYGTDLVLDEGTPIYAMADGFVLYSQRDYVNGRFVKLDHGYGLTSAYVHNSKLLVREGELVEKGQVIALSGATGRVTGPHLHFQVEIDRQPVDPETFRERKAPRAHRRSVEAEAIGCAHLPH